jgi:uncharacterized iron-regulated membrane protein
MALSMDEQRILDEIERGLGNADPLLAARLSSFGFRRRALTLRTRRARIVVSFITLIAVAAMSLVVYSLVPFRNVADRHSAGRSAASPRQAAMTAPHRPSGSPSASSASAPGARVASRSTTPSTRAAHPVPPPTRAQ